MLLEIIIFHTYLLLLLYTKYTQIKFVLHLDCVDLDLFFCIKYPVAESSVLSYCQHL